MPPVRIKYVISFSSQAPKNTVEDLVKGRGSWLSDTSDRTGRLQADIQLERATTISYIDVGNAGSVMLSVEVGRSSWPTSKPLVTLLPTMALMTPAEWRSGKNAKAVRMFKKEDLAKDAIKEKWDRVRIICTQPFRKDAQFGLALFGLHTTDECQMQEESSPVIKIQSPHASLKKDELVSRMNLPTKQKKVMSQNLGWLENKVLTNGDDANAINPMTSPVSRAAKLVVMATKPINKESVATHKASLECEALDFLISLNLSLGEINSLKVSGVRQQFEQQRQKLLTHDEKVIFKDIALDYAQKRLESLEKKLESSMENNSRWDTSSVKKKQHQQQKMLQKEKENKFKGNIPKNFQNKDAIQERLKSESGTGKISNSAPKANPPLRPQGKFTFKRIDAPGSSLALLKKTPVRHTENRNGDDLKVKSPPGLSRNGLALSDSKVTTPKSSRGRPKKSFTPKTESNKQSTVSTWLTPKAKRKRDHSDIEQFSKDISEVSNGLHRNDSDDDDSIAKDIQGGGFLDDRTPWTNASTEGRNFPSTSTESGHSLGSAPSDKYGVTQAKKRSKGNSSEHVHSARPSHAGHSSTMMECPLCSGFFPPSKIESHAASCGIVVSSDSDLESDDSTVRGENRGGSVEECPICGDFISSSDLQDHAAECANSTYG